MWAFSFHSLFREYGWQFLRHVALPHPIKTVKAVMASNHLDYSGDMTAVGSIEQKNGRCKSIVGVGFCLKPLHPPCISGRANHECHYLEKIFPSGSGKIPECCQRCAIRNIGVKTLEAGSAFYIMTSARDILFDVYLPALKNKHFNAGFFLLCRYSLQPFAVGMLVSGISGSLLPFSSGDCQDYKTWLLADEGTKEERTSISEEVQKIVNEKLTHLKNQSNTPICIEKQGNVFFCCGE